MGAAAQPNNILSYIPLLLTNIGCCESLSYVNGALRYLAGGTKDKTLLVKWECKYHIVWCPKYRRKTLYGKIRKRFGEIIHDLCRQKGITLVEGHAQPDHVHLCLSIPPKYSVAVIVGFLKGKSAIRLHKEFSNTRSTGKHFWIRGYFVSTVGLDLEVIREYIRHQSVSDKRQLSLPDFD